MLIKKLIAVTVAVTIIASNAHAVYTWRGRELIGAQMFTDGVFPTWPKQWVQWMWLWPKGDTRQVYQGKRRFASPDGCMDAFDAELAIKNALQYARERGTKVVIGCKLQGLGI